MSTDEIAHKTAWSHVQQQAGSETVLLVPGVEEDHPGSLGEDLFGTGIEFLHIGRKGNARQEFGPQLAVGLGKDIPLCHRERCRSPRRLVLETPRHGGVDREGVIMIASGAVRLQAVGQTRRDGPAPGGSSLPQRLRQSFFELRRRLSSRKRIAHRHQPVLGRNEQVGTNQERLATRHGFHENRRMFGNDSPGQDILHLGRFHSSTPVSPQRKNSMTAG